jgi:hypothetical protein
VLKKYEKTVVKMGLLQVAASKTLMTDMADLLESTRKDEGWTSSKKKRQSEARESWGGSAEQGQPVPYLKAEHKEKTKEKRALLDCPFVAMKSGRTRRNDCWWKQ